MFPAGVILVLHTFGFWVWPVHIGSFYPVSKVLLCILKSLKLPTLCWPLDWITEA